MFCLENPCWTEQPGLQSRVAKSDTAEQLTAQVIDWRSHVAFGGEAAPEKSAIMGRTAQTGRPLLGRPLPAEAERGRPMGTVLHGLLHHDA